MEAARVLTLVPDPLAEWERLTRFLESARIAFLRERAAWEGVENPAAVRVASAAFQASYRVGLDQHLAALDEGEMLYASVLLHSYALCESAAADRLRLDPRDTAGIEDWGARLLRAAGRDWTEVKGGLGGAVEVAVVRNAFAHGTRTIDAGAHARLSAAGAQTRNIGARVTLTYPWLRGYRNRLLALMRAGGIGE
jgi:hypothetical protein